MAYLTGITTWGNLLTDFRELVCGRKTDDYGASVPANEQWRDIVSGLGGAATMVLSPPASTSDLESLQEHRAGYWARVDDCAVFFDRTGTFRQHVRQTSIWNGWHANFQDTLCVSLKVLTRNTVSGNYSNAQIVWSAYSLSAAGAITQVRSGLTVSPNADGDVTLTYTSGTTVSCTIKLSNPETGFLETNTFFYRNFQSQYRGGIDGWRNYIKRTGPLNVIEAPTGTEDVDWSFTGRAGVANAYDTSATYIQFPTSGNPVNIHIAHGLGIKTNLGLSGDRYEVSFDYTHAWWYFFISGLAIYARWGAASLPANGVANTAIEGGKSSLADVLFLSPFATQPISTTEVQYFITVREDSLAITLYGDPALQGRVTSNMFARISGYDENDPNTTWACGRNQEGQPGNNNAIDEYRRFGPHMVIENVMVRGWMDEGRNWQTGDGRWDTMVHMQGIAGYTDGAQGMNLQNSDLADTRFISQLDTRASIPNTNTSPDTYRLLKEPGWRASSWTLSDGIFSYTDITSFNGVGIERERGYIEDPSLILIPQGSYATGDELLDLTTNNRYKLFGRNSWSGWVTARGPGYAQAMF